MVSKGTLTAVLPKKIISNQDLETANQEESEHHVEAPQNSWKAKTPTGKQPVTSD